MEVQRLFDLPAYQAERYPRDNAFCRRVNDQWVHFSSEEMVSQIHRFSRGLIAMGIRPGENIALLCPNRPEWNIIDLAIMQVGAVCVPIYPTLSDREYQYVFNHAEIRLAIVGNEELYHRLSGMSIDTLKDIFCIEKITGIKHWEEIAEQGANVQQAEVEKRMAAIDSETLATIIYTSGTTGVPKGVMLCHRNIVSNIQAVIQLLPITHEHRVMSFLPMSHIFERMVVYTYMHLGCAVYYEEDLDRLMLSIQEVKPHFFATVPRLLEKIYENMLARGYEMSGPVRKLYFWAMNVGLRFQVDTNQGWRYAWRLAIARRLVFRRWQKAMGGELIAIVTGAVALPPKLCKIFSAAGIAVREGYGQTESAPVISFNRFEPGGTLEGTVGVPIPGVEVKIAADGEICVRGPNVMLGYYKDPEATREVIDAEGWLQTGDVGKIVKGRFIKLTDRIKELFKTSGGKYIAPQPIENRFRDSLYIDQIMVVGADQKFAAALISPAFEPLREWMIQRGIQPEDNAAMIRNLAVKELYQGICNEYNTEFSQIEKIKKFELVPDTWSSESGELTPTQKLKRRVLLEKYRSEIDHLYHI
ncbi:MAG: long-chain fatty acid--CoA ligase [Bacteroidia bacterium]|nr:long-chain fatty acid--CoA ligase [Bacteroidia bacterium]